MTVTFSFLPVCGSRVWTVNGSKTPSSRTKPWSLKSGGTLPAFQLSRRGATIASTTARRGVWAIACQTSSALS